MLKVMIAIARIDKARNSGAGKRLAQPIIPHKRSQRGKTAVKENKMKTGQKVR